MNKIKTVYNDHPHSFIFIVQYIYNIKTQTNTHMLRFSNLLPYEILQIRHSSNQLTIKVLDILTHSLTHLDSRMPCY